MSLEEKPEEKKEEPIEEELSARDVSHVLPAVEDEKPEEEEPAEERPAEKKPWWKFW